MVVVTGGAGFIGSHLIEALNRAGIDNIIVVDDIVPAHKSRNLERLRFQDVIGIDLFPAMLAKNRFGKSLQMFLHEGALTDTLEDNASKLMARNLEYSTVLLNFAVANKIPFVYASSAAVYGSGPDFSETAGEKKPLNSYGMSKLLFDQRVLAALPHAGSTVAGLRYFNVYGSNEAHKGRMASMVYQAYRQLRETGVVRLFAGTDGFADGEQARDFVYVADVVDINLFFAMGKQKTGIYNVGTGQARRFNEVAGCWISQMGCGEVEYTPMPEHIRRNYQSFTRADLARLRRCGYRKAFIPLEDGIALLFEAFQNETKDGLAK